MGFAFASALALAGLLGSCSVDPVRPESRAAGSETMLPLLSVSSGLLAEQEQDARIRLDSSTSADGIALFCDGLVEMAASSRSMSDREKEQCKDSDRSPVEIPVANDAIVVVTNPSNPVKCLSTEQLYGLAGPESAGFASWADANSLGSSADLPDQPLKVLVPPSGSGTLQLFVSTALGPTAETRNTDPKLRNDAVSVESNELVRSAVLDEQAGLGVAAVSSAKSWKDSVRILQLRSDSSAECADPTEANVASGAYPLGRSLSVIVDRRTVEQDQTISDLVSLLLSAEGQKAVAETGALPLDPSQLKESQRLWNTVIE